MQILYISSPSLTKKSFRDEQLSEVILYRDDEESDCNMLAKEDAFMGAE